MTESERVRLLAGHRVPRGNWHDEPEGCPVVAKHGRPWDLRREPNPQSSQRYRHWHLTYNPKLDGENNPHKPVDMWFYTFAYALEYMRVVMRDHA